MNKFIAIILTVIAIAALSSSPSSAQMGMAEVALNAKKQGAQPAAAWLGDLQLAFSADDSNWINAANGSRLMRRPRESLALNGVRHPVAHFYAPQNLRAHVVAHYAGRAVGEVISVGVDSGYRAPKLTVAPAVFVGYARSFSMRAANPNHARYVTVAAGGWLGGDITHRPCVDAFNREYYCGGANLIAWSDFTPPSSSSRAYYRLVFTNEF